MYTYEVYYNDTVKLVCTAVTRPERGGLMIVQPTKHFYVHVHMLILLFTLWDVYTIRCMAVLES